MVSLPNITSRVLAFFAIIIISLTMIPVYLNTVSYQIPNIIIKLRKVCKPKLVKWARTANKGVFDEQDISETD